MVQGVSPAGAIDMFVRETLRPRGAGRGIGSIRRVEGYCEIVEFGCGRDRGDW